MTPTAKRRRYRTDPAFRAAILESNRRSRERDPNPNRGRLNVLAATICRVRESIDYHARMVAKQEKRLLALCEERDSLKTRRAQC